MNTTTPTIPVNGLAPVSQLLSETLEYCTLYWRTLLLGAVVVGVVLGLFNITIGAKTLEVVGRSMQGAGVNVQRMQELSSRMEQGDETALAELEDLLKNVDVAAEGSAMVGPGKAMMKELLPYLSMAGIVGWLLGMLAHAFYVLVAVEGKALGATRWQMILPLIGVSLWSLLRSFIWIPFLGLIPALILWPRFIAAPLILLTEGTGVRASVRESYRRTSSYWAKIVGNLIIACIVIVVTSMFLNIVLGMVVGTMPAMIVAGQILQQVFMAFLTVFAVRLSHTILLHPRA